MQSSCSFRSCTRQQRVKAFFFFNLIFKNAEKQKQKKKEEEEENDADGIAVR